MSYNVPLCHWALCFAFLACNGIRFGHTTNLEARRARCFAFKMWSRQCRQRRSFNAQVHALPFAQYNGFHIGQFLASLWYQCSTKCIVRIFRSINCVHCCHIGTITTSFYTRPNGTRKQWIFGTGTRACCWKLDINNWMLGPRIHRINKLYCTQWKFVVCHNGNNTCGYHKHGHTQKYEWQDKFYNNVALRNGGFKFILGFRVIGIDAGHGVFCFWQVSRKAKKHNVFQLTNTTKIVAKENDSNFWECLTCIFIFGFNNTTKLCHWVF